MWLVAHSATVLEDPGSGTVLINIVGEPVLAEGSAYQSVAGGLATKRLGDQESAKLYELET